MNIGHNKKRCVSLLQETTSHQVICYYKSKSQRTQSHLQIFTSKSQSLFCKFHEMMALCSFRHSIKDFAWKVCRRWTQQCPSSRIQQTGRDCVRDASGSPGCRTVPETLGTIPKYKGNGADRTGGSQPHPVFEASAQGTAPSHFH